MLGKHRLARLARLKRGLIKRGESHRAAMEAEARHVAARYAQACDWWKTIAAGVGAGLTLRSILQPARGRWINRILSCVHLAAQIQRWRGPQNQEGFE